jgi:hypothetical protein
MLTYYITGSNHFVVRTKQTTSGSFSLHLQDMYTFKNTTGSLTGVTYDPYESLLYFTASISGAKEGDQFRVEIKNNVDSIYQGSLTAFNALSSSKSNYETQITSYESYQSTNEYIIL